jgi:CRISPR/Cas system-associated protein Csm6
VDGDRGDRVITIPTDAEIERDARIAEKHARYVAALEAEVAAWVACEREAHGDYSDEDWKAAQRRLGECHGETMLARAEWEAERGKA